MGDRFAIVLDTNFIFSEVSKLNKTLEQLVGLYNVYIAQISIDERKEQRCRAFMERYERFNIFCQEYRYLFTLEDTTDCEEAKEKLRARMQAKYELAFQKRIIPFNSSKNFR